MRAPSRRRSADEVTQRAAHAADHGQQAADRPTHQRYYTVISRAVTEQGDNTFSSRQALYERARAAQMAALQKYHPPLTKNNFARERQALEQAIVLVEQENASPLWSRTHLESNGSELTPAANQGQPSGDRLSVFSKIEKGALGLFALVVLALSFLIFVRGVWITDTAVSYLAWPINMITKTGYPPSLATYRVVYSDGLAQEIRLFPEEIERWVRMSNIANAERQHRVVRVIDPQGRVVWEQ